MAWLPDGEKNFEDISIRFDTIHERDRHTHRQTPHDGIGRAYASHRAAKTEVQGSSPVLAPVLVAFRRI